MIVTYDGATPSLAPDAWLAPDATLIGAVTLAAQSSVWYTSVLRADDDRIELGPASNIQDGSVLHPDAGLPVIVGRGVTVGHRAILHGCTIGDDVLVGMGAVILNGATIGAGSLIAAGTVVLEGTQIPPGCLVAGVPGKVRRDLTPADLDSIRRNASIYVDLAARHAAAVASSS
jgi:carbonic anhydrase/acetyltransferase-like protein (isoleucine patch superfamily)